MNWIDKLWTFRAEALKELQKLLEEKGYDKSDLDGQEMYDLPYVVYTGDLSSELYSIYLWDKVEGCFMGKGWDSGEPFAFYFHDLDTQCICNLIDLINEN